MNYSVTRHSGAITLDKRQTISKRYRIVTRAINREFWQSESDTLHSFYVGSYGRRTAINTSDIDILVELPISEYDRFQTISGNGPSRLLQAVRTAIKKSYPMSDVRADGQIIKINFHDGIQFELLPAFKEENYWTKETSYIYPNSNMGGSWQSTNPKAEQEAMKSKNSESQSNGLLIATCRHLRYIRDTYYKSYKLSGIVIDSFVYTAMNNWRYVEKGTSTSNSESYEQILLNYYNNKVMYGMNFLTLHAPGSGQPVDTADSFECLGKVLNKINS